MASKKRQRCHLSLQTKIEVIRKAKSDPKLSVRALSEHFGCGKTKISDILKAKESILTLYESNASSSMSRTTAKSRSSEYSEVNDTLYKWYLLACSKNIYPCGPQLIEKAKEIAAQIEFKGTNGWLQKWKKRYNIRRVAVQGESGDVSGETIESWKERLPEILKSIKRKTYTT